MLKFTVNDMTCGHCVSTITQAIKLASPQAVVQIDLEKHLVQVTATDAQADIAGAITQAGFTPVLKS